MRAVAIRFFQSFEDSLLFHLVEWDHSPILGRRRHGLPFLNGRLLGYLKDNGFADGAVWRSPAPGCWP